MTKRTEENQQKLKEEEEKREAKKSKTDDSTCTYVDIPPPRIMKSRTSKKLSLPVKKKKTLTPNTGEKVEIFNEKLKEAENDVPEEDKFECPNCFEVLKKPFPKNVEAEIKRINNNEKKHRTEQIKQHNAEIKLLKKEGGIEKPLFIKKLEIPEDTAKKFCRLHKIELKMRPLAEKKHYPMIIRFDKLDGRVKRMEKSLLDIIHGKTDSTFFNDIKKIYVEEGSNQARTTFSLMRRFDKALPGYYGPRGSVILIEELGKLFMETGLLKKEYTKPLQPVEYLQQVLVPETAVRLIQEDLRTKKLPNSWDDALNVMKDSIEFGAVVHAEKQE